MLLLARKFDFRLPNQRFIIQRTGVCVLTRKRLPAVFTVHVESLNVSSAQFRRPISPAQLSSTMNPAI